MEHTDSECIDHEPCPKCGSSDNLARYDDGHGYCFGCQHYEHGSGSNIAVAPQPKERAMTGLLEGDYDDLMARGIKEKTCRFFDYQLGYDGKKQVQIANYRGPEGGPVVAQKIRGRDKQFYATGDMKIAGLYGQWLWRDQGKMIVITEGEIDALSISQLQDNKWPVVSIPLGAVSAKKALAKNLKWILGFDTIVLFFDDDEPGRAAVEACSRLFPPGRLKVARMPGYKDANEALVAGKSKLIIDAIWGAKEHRPDGIVTAADLRDAAKQAPIEGGSLPWPTLTKWTHGRRPTEVWMIGAGTGIGKSEVFDEIIAHIIQQDDVPVGVFKFEQPATETVKRIAGKIAGKRFNVPDRGWKQDELDKAVDYVADGGRLFMYDHFGQCEWDVVKDHIRFLNAAYGVNDFFIDHLTALAGAGADERGSLETIMKEVSMLAEELNITMFLISHLATPDGTPHEEGGRVMIRHFKGSRAIGFWSHVMIGLERNQQHEDPRWRGITTVRSLKERLTGESVGETFHLKFDVETGTLTETLAPDAHEADGGFVDETKGSPF